MVRNKEKLEDLATGMDAGNDHAVRSSSATILVLSDLSLSVCRVLFVDPEKDAPTGMGLLLLTYYTNTILNVLFGWIFDLFFSFLRLFRTSPRRFSREAWSFQQCGFMIQNLILLAKSKGIGTSFLGKRINRRLAYHGRVYRRQGSSDHEDS